MIRLFVGTSGAVILGLFCIVAWLFWPLPTNEFDWQEQASVHIDNKECNAAVWVLMSIYGGSEDPYALEMMRQVDAIENCDDGRNRSYLATIEQFEQMPPTVFAGIPPRPNYVEVVRMSIEDYLLYRRTHAAIDDTFLGWNVAVDSFRCSRVFRDEFEQHWRSTRLMVSEEIGLPGSLATWDRRQMECQNLMRSQTEALLINGAAETEIGGELLREYRMRYDLYY